MVDADILTLVAEVGTALKISGERIVTAESCTGGELAQSLTSVPGSSSWFERGYVTYSDRSKTEMLGVPAGLIVDHGAVSEQAVRAMAEGALARSGASLSVAITGIAGPGGGSTDKPVGTVWIGWSRAGRATRAKRFLFTGDRNVIRGHSVRAALRGLVESMREPGA